MIKLISVPACFTLSNFAVEQTWSSPKDYVLDQIDQRCAYAEILKVLKASKDINPVEKPEEKKLLSVDEAAELFGIGRNKIRELTNDKDCPLVIWIGSHWRIKREAFEKFISGQNAV